MHRAMSPEYPHIPVLLHPVLDLLRPDRARVLVDCTAGLGGHAEALLRAAPPDARMLVLDADAENLARAKQRLEPLAAGRARFFHANFADLAEVLAAADVERADAVLADLGVASSQIDDPQRGMSFQAPGPLDMRLDRSAGPTAAELVNRLDERTLADLIFRNADERASRRIARAIVEARRRGPIATTQELAAVVERALGGRRGARIHPATRTFQALRIAVNDELGSLDCLLEALPRLLAPGGRVAMVSFHSLEDRRVKQAFSAWKSAGIARIIAPAPVLPDDEELRANPRSRSAKLRAAERL